MNHFVIDAGDSYDVINGKSLSDVQAVLVAAGLRRRAFPAPELTWTLLHETTHGDARVPRITEHYRLPNGTIIRTRLTLPDDGTAEMFTPNGWVEIASIHRGSDLMPHQNRTHRIRMLDLELRGLVERILIPHAITEPAHDPTRIPPQPELYA